MRLDIQKLKPLQNHSVAILGYGNQGHAHALNLRDSSISVVVGGRPGKSLEQAKLAGFETLSYEAAVEKASVVVFLTPDPVIPEIYRLVEKSLLLGKKTVGFAHGYAYHFKEISVSPLLDYFLVGPKGAGAVLRSRYVSGQGLPGVYATSRESSELKELAVAYAEAIGLGSQILIPTTFQEETECDLFGEQAVLCGGLLELMETAFETLVRNGHSREMAFFECCFEVMTIMELWLKYGPLEMSKKISPTAFYGGTTRGPRLITEETKKEMQKIFEEIRGGSFGKEWSSEISKGTPQLEEKRKQLAGSALNAVFQKLSHSLSSGKP